MEIIQGSHGKSDPRLIGFMQEDYNYAFRHYLYSWLHFFVGILALFSYKRLYQDPNIPIKSLSHLLH